MKAPGKAKTRCGNRVFSEVFVHRQENRCLSHEPSR
jgi:hypothetical protein